MIIALFLLATAISSQEQARSAVDEWRDTLLYGINSEITELLPTLIENEEEELLPEVVQLFESGTDSGVLTAAAEYLRAFSANEGTDRAEALIQEYETRPDDLLTAVSEYLIAVEATISEETTTALFQLVEERATVASVAVRLLAAAGTPTEELIELYRSGDVDNEVRGRILIELGNRGDSEVFSFVREIISEDEEATTMLQRYAIDTLGKLGDERGLPTIIRQFDSDDAMTRAYAASALTGFDTPEAREALIAALRDSFWRVRVAALEAIAERGISEATPAVMYKARRDPEQRVRLEAIETLVALDNGDGWRLLEEMAAQRNGGVEIRAAVLDHLIRNRPRQSRDIVLAVVEEEWNRDNSRLLDIIGRAVSQVSSQSVEPIVARLADHRNYLLQIYALRAIGKNQLMSLREIALDRSREGNHRAIRSAALRALDQLGIQPDSVEDETMDDRSSEVGPSAETGNGPDAVEGGGSGDDEP